MKKIIISSLLIVAVTLGFTLKFVNVEKMEQQEKKIQDEREEKINTYMQNMSLEEKIGQMLIISKRVPSMTEELRNELTTIQPGGFIFFAENFTNHTNTTTLITEINQTAKIPYILSVDQEGGRVQRLKKQEDIDVNTIPSMQEIGETKDPNIAFQVGTQIGKDLKRYGLNMNFAPVLDTLTNNENKSILGRSFGSDYNLVSNMGLSLSKGLKETGIIPVYKHFPGHGSTTVDSHYDLPVLTKSKEELRKSDLIPFQNAIENDAEVIMIGHLAIPNITNDQTPSSLSKEIITDLLKKEMGFNGLVVTDALNMKALTKYYSEAEIYEKAINAGVDLLLMPEHPNQAIYWIKESISNGKISEEQINDSVKKILNLKYKYCNFLKEENN